MHVLLVEDHALLRRMLEQVLTDAGLRVTVAETADQAMTIFEGGLRPDLLLSDIRMPGQLSGLDLARWTRQRHPSLAILLQTGFADLDTGELRVLRKPFAPDMLLAAVRESLAGCTPEPGDGAVVK